MKRLIYLLAIITATANGYLVQFSPHPDNVGVQLATICGGEKPYRAVNQCEISSTTSQVVFRRQPTPPGVFCQVIASIMRESEHGEYVSESAATTQTN